jgi:hypothetical protein
VPAGRAVRLLRTTISNQVFDVVVAEVITGEPCAPAQRIAWVVDDGTIHRRPQGDRPPRSAQPTRAGRLNEPP